MSGRLALDFGTSNSVAAVWDEARGDSATLHVPDYGRISMQGSEQISVVPSIIHYASAANPAGAQSQQLWIGEQVLQRGLYQNNQTFRWMKRYIINRSPLQKLIGGRRISPAEAGRDFISSVLLAAYAAPGGAGLESPGLSPASEEIALTVPVEAFEHYENWLEQTLENARLPRFRLIDEPSAAALGYGAHIQPGDVYLIFDFGGGTLDVAVVLIEAEAELQAGKASGPVQNALVGRRCRVLGKAGLELGGMTIDSWIFQEVLRRSGRSDADEDIRPISGALLVECERVKEQLSQHEQASLSVVNPQTGAAIYAEFSRSEFERLLDEHGAFEEIDRTIRRAINASRERGYSEEHIKAVLMVGGSSQIPAVSQTLRRIFGKERVMLNRPLDAIARGAAAFIAGVDFYDHIQHDYAIRFFNRAKNDYDYRVLVGRGTAYPTPEPVAKLTIKATFEGQTQLGLAVYEMSERGAARPQPDGAGRLELVFDPSGAARLSTVAPDEEERRASFWMNENQPTFLNADPPGMPGEPRFEVQFSIDANKHLLISARDLKTNKTTHRDYPVVKLS